MDPAKDRKPSLDQAATQDMTKDITCGEIIDQVSKTGNDEILDRDLADEVARYQPGSQAEKRLLWQIDLMLLPILWLMCVLAYVDRNNIVKILLCHTF
jgi:hypothetical protein